MSFSKLYWLSTCLMMAPAFAQDSSLLVDLNQRVMQMESDLRASKDTVETLRHQIQELNTQLADLKATGGATSAVPGGAPAAAAPMGSAEGATVPHTLEPAPLEAGGAIHPKEAYEQARALLEKANYDAAEKAFADFVQQHPQDDNAANAQYWLGVTFFVRGQHEKAIAAFAKGFKQYPKAAKAPDMLMKMGKSLAKLNRTADACTTFKQLGAAYPDAHKADREAEMKALSCKE